jgi:hypothetical protein
MADALDREDKDHAGRKSARGLHKKTTIAAHAHMFMIAGTRAMSRGRRRGDPSF